MTEFSEAMTAYKKQMAKGKLPIAYKGLMEYLMGLRTQLKNSHPDFYVSGNFYQGYMDMTYFSFTPNSFRKRKLRIAIVFVHSTCEFKIWLGGINKKVQTEYWKLFRSRKWNKYSIPETLEGLEFIIESKPIPNPDFSNLAKLSKQIEKQTLTFSRDIENFLGSTKR
ncbi:DUF7000 family protein [Aurantivibrio infirmus]